MMCSRSSVAVERRGRVVSSVLLCSALACALGGCLPSSGDLSEYSADWSPPVAASEQQTLPNQQQPTEQTADPGGATNDPGQNDPGQRSAPSGSNAPPAAASASQPSSNSELPPTALAPPAATSQGTSGSATAEPAASETPPSSMPPPSLPTPAEQCADGVLDAGQNSCYLVATVPATWQVARGDCAVWGGALVKVESTEEDQLIGQLVTQDLWLGASDTVAENVFVWTDGSPILFGNWGPAQPDRFPGPDCVQKRSTAGRQWFDQPCDNNWLYVCEKPIRR